MGCLKLTYSENNDTLKVAHSSYKENQKYYTGSYRYGMNTQEKDDEIAQGIYSALYWEYDSRLGRRWNIDPVTQPAQSPYACFDNNPIFFNDILGNVAGGGDDDKPADGKSKEKITVNFMYVGSQDKDMKQAYEINMEAAKKDPSYKVFKVESLKEAASKMEELSKDFDVTTAYFSSHGYSGHSSMKFGTSNIGSAENVKSYAAEFKTIGDNMAKDGMIVLMSCGVGRDDQFGGSIVGSVASASGKMTLGGQGFSFPAKIPQGSQQAAYPFVVGADKNLNSFKGLYQNTGKWTVARPMLSNPKGYEQMVIGAPSLGVHGLTGLDMKMQWLNKNYNILQTEAKKQKVKL